uniref:Large ribosomal subunit protein eL14 domain-containing protein n=1 Tax=Alexandrium monilatum TaxID=311494 RepID=A0A7S4VF99_9DINO
MSASMFKRFVEPGRLALITYGPCAGKMCTIIDIVDQQRVVVDGPASVTGVRRHMMPIKRLSLTDFKAGIGRGAREKALKKALADGEVMKKWEATSWAKKLKAREVRQNMTDFERFKLMVAKKNRSKAIKKVLKKK